MGLPSLSVRDRQLVNLHNVLFRRSMKLALASLLSGQSGYIENPRTSMLWKTRQIRKLLLNGAHFVDFDMCQFRRPYKKATRLLVWGSFSAA